MKRFLQGSTDTCENTKKTNAPASSSSASSASIPAELLVPFTENGAALPTPCIYKDISLLSTQDQEKIIKTEKLDGWYESNGLLGFLQPSTSLAREQKKAKTLIYAFDMDSTLIKTKSGKKFPTGPTDWTLLSPKIKSTLDELCSSPPEDTDVFFVIFSNQLGLKEKPDKILGFKSKITSVLAELSQPRFDFYASISSNRFRKPYTGMWDFYLLSLARRLSVVPASASVAEAQELLSHFRKNTHVVFVGDAAGRSDDFSASDIRFAANIGAEFFTPEQFFFKNEKGKTNVHSDKECPRLCEMPQLKTYPPVLFESLSSKEIILLVGPPSCGKSSLSLKLKTHFQERGLDYLVVNRDKQGAKHTALGEEHIRAGRHGLIVDNTNINRSSRAIWIGLAKKYGYSIRSIFIEISKDLATSLSKFRMISPHTPPEDQREISSIVYNKLYKDLEPPSLTEGLERLDNFQWVPLQLPTDAHPVHQKLYTLYF